MIVEIFLDDDVEHRHRKGGVRAGAQLEMDIGASRKPIDARVDLDEARSAAHRINDGMAEEARQGSTRGEPYPT